MDERVNYPYLFQTCGFRNVDNIRAELESQRDWDYVKDSEQALRIVEEAAARFGFKLPFSDDQIQLATYLKRKRAGLNICTYAWGLYADSLKSEKPKKLFA